MEILSDKGMDDLRFAIVRKACEDYEASLSYLRKPSWQKKKDKEMEMIRLRDDCIRFFRNEYFALLYDLEGEEVMQMIRKKFYNRPIRWGDEHKKKEMGKNAKK